MKKTLKLYVWTNFCPDYTGGLAVALAKDEASARAQVIKEHEYDPSRWDCWGDLTIYPVNEPMAVTVSGGR